MGRSGFGIMDPFLFPYLFLFSSLFSSKGGKFSFCRFAEKKNRGTGKEASYLLEVEVTFSGRHRCLLLPEDGTGAPVVHHALWNTEQKQRNGIGLKIHHLSSIWILARFSSILDSPTLGIIPMYVSFAYVRMDLLSDEYDTTYQIIKKDFMITKIRILFARIGCS